MGKAVKAVRAGSDRAKVIRWADEGVKVDQMVKHLKTYRGNVLATLSSLKREKVILGYAIADDDTVKLKLSKGTTAAMLVSK
jgi:hypothetical protein